MKIKSPLLHTLKTSLPAALDLASQTILWIIEAIFIGKLSGAALAGHGMAIQIVLVFFAVLLTFVVGASLIINRFIGNNESYQANHIFGQTMFVAAIMAVIFALIWHFGAVHLFKLIKEGADASAQIAGVTYIKTVSYFAPFIILNFVAVGIIRATGDSHYSMLVNLSLNALNVVLSPLLIFGLFAFPRLEVQGAALALGISHTCGFLVTLFLLRSRRLKIFLSFREMTTPKFKSVKELFKMGLPTTVEQLTWALGQLVVTSYCGLLSVTILATQTVFMRIQNVLSMTYMGFGLAAMSNMGQSIGAQDSSLAEKMAKTANRTMAVYVALVVIVMMSFERPLVSVFTTDPATLAMGHATMFMFALAQIPKALANVLAGSMRGAGQLKWLMWITVVFVIVFEVSFNYVSAFVLGWGLIGVWAIQASDESLRLIINYIWFHKGDWKFIKK